VPAATGGPTCCANANSGGDRSLVKTGYRDHDVSEERGRNAKRLLG
jgi:hypothetical protein